MGVVTRQEMQNMLDQACRRVQDQVASKQDVQRSADNARDRMISYMHDYLQQNQQQFMRQLDDRTRIFKGQVTSLEARIQSLEQEVRMSHQLLSQMAQKQSTIVIPGLQEAAHGRRDYRYLQEG